MSIDLRYFLIGFIAVSDLSADSLSTKLMTQLETLAVDYTSKLIGQRCDGAIVLCVENINVLQPW